MPQESSHVETPCRISRSCVAGCAAQMRGPNRPSRRADPRAALLKLLPAGSKLEDLKPSPIPGIYQFVRRART